MDAVQVLTVEQVAERVQLSAKTVMRAIRAGDLEASQLTQGRGGWRVREDAIVGWLEVRSNRADPGRSPMCVGCSRPGRDVPLGGRHRFRPVGDWSPELAIVKRSASEAGNSTWCGTAAASRCGRSMGLAIPGSLEGTGEWPAPSR